MKYVIIFFLSFSAYGQMTFQDEVWAMNDALKTHVEVPYHVTGNDREESYSLKLIRLRLRGTVGLEVPKFLTFEIKPFVEIYWKKPLPVGWKERKN